MRNPAGLSVAAFSDSARDKGLQPTVMPPKAILLGLGALCSSVLAAPRVARPNIIFIMSVRPSA